MFVCRVKSGLLASDRLVAPSYCYCRYLYTSVAAYSKKRGRSEDLKIESRPPSQSDHDLIGPANPESNIRPTLYYVPPRDTPLEREFRSRRQDVYQWNHDFWARHNKRFAQEKQMFTVAKLHQLGEYQDDGSRRTLSAEEMSEFYKRFLEENFPLMENYHREWYRKNNSLTFLYLRVYLQRLWSALTNRRPASYR